MGKRIRDLTWEDYGISKNRYRELLYFCRQYPEKKKQMMYGLKAVANDGMPKGSTVGKPTEAEAIQNVFLQRDIEVIERAAALTGKIMKPFILKNVCESIPYEHLGAVPVCRNDFYGIRRLFFGNLDKLKK